MKLTSKILRGIVKEVITENKKSSMLLMEAEVSLTVDEVMAKLNDPNRRAELQRVGIMTSENPRGQQSNLQTNRNGLEEFKRDLDQRGLDFVSLGGMYGNPENSLFILNPTKQDIIDYGKKYGQSAVIFGQRLVRNYRPGQPSIYFRIDYYQTEPDDPKAPPFHPQEYYLVDSRDMMVADASAQQRTDYYSEIGGRKFFIPFFSSDPQHQMSSEPGAQAAVRESNFVRR